MEKSTQSKVFFEVAVQHLSRKFFKTHLRQSTFQQSCYIMLATMLKNLLCDGGFPRNSLKVSSTAAVTNIIGEKKYEHQKTNQTIQEEQAVFV